jgi:hypothetical protein
MAKKKEIKKIWWHSKTVWVNGLALLGGLFLAFSGHLAAGGIITVGSAANLVLRVVTKQAVKW